MVEKIEGEIEESESSEKVEVESRHKLWHQKRKRGLKAVKGKEEAGLKDK